MQRLPNIHRQKIPGDSSKLFMLNPSLPNQEQVSISSFYALDISASTLMLLRINCSLTVP